jgi:quercetin dioxygenase-like cupin family protein
MEGSGITLAFAASTDSSPPPSGLPGRASLLGADRTAGVVNWYFIDFPPGETTPFHHTHSLDFDVVVAGSIDVLLDDGTHRLERGDAIFLKGVDHAWRTHDEACRMSVAVVATAPPDGT